jgi:phosphinothricin acetyltransferase
MLRRVLRPMDAEDWPAVREIYELGIATGLATLECECPCWDDWDAVHIGGQRLVAAEDDLVVGWAALARPHRTVGPGVAESSVYVRPGWHGRRIGSNLLEHLVRESELAGYWTIEARILEENIASRRLHEGQGFRLVGVRERIGMLAGAWRNVLLLERRSPVVGRP